MSEICNHFKVDETTLAWLDGVLTIVKDGNPVVPTNKDVVELAPCGGFLYNTEVLKANKHVLELVDGDVSGESFTICGGISFDTASFKYEDKVLSAIFKVVPSIPPTESEDKKESPDEDQGK